jgi:hypothetical protein
MLHPGTLCYWYRHQEKFIPNFSEESPVMHSNNISMLVYKIGLSEYDPSEWRLFIAALREVKDVLFHNGNVFVSVPITHSVLLKESNKNIETLDQVPGTQLASLW